MVARLHIPASGDRRTPRSPARGVPIMNYKTLKARIVPALPFNQDIYEALPTEHVTSRSSDDSESRFLGTS
jgi:hypothetical protein